METLPDKIKRKRPSKGKRKHTRRMKQEARKASGAGTDTKKRTGTK